jgi:hypothetical protein
MRTTVAAWSISAAILAASTIPASATFLSFGFTGLGSVTLTPGPDIAANTIKEELPSVEFVNSIRTPVNAAIAGIDLFSPVVFDLYTLPVRFNFTDISTAAAVPTTNGSAGFLTATLLGTVISDNSFDTRFLDQPVQLSVGCTQARKGAAIDCSHSVATVSAVPEPMSLSLLGFAIVAMGAVRRRRSLP